MKRPSSLRGLRRAVDYSLAYLWRYFLGGGLVPVVLFGLLMSSGDVAGVLLMVHVFSLMVIFPGAILVNFAGVRHLRSRDWRHHPRRPRAAAFLTVWILWVGVLLMLAVPLPPANFLVQRIGGDWSWFLHVVSWLILASTAGLVGAWVPSPRAAKEAGMSVLPPAVAKGRG